MSPAETTILVVYFSVLAVLCAYGGHRFLVTWLYYRHKSDREQELVTREEELPAVTVQLPIYNERYVLPRLVEAVCNLDYPADRLEIQILDDSTDDTVTRAGELAAEHRQRGVDIVHIHREDRIGYKAGALEAGLGRAKGELVAVFDADFLPSPDFLKRTVAGFADPQVGMVQVRWEHLNRDYSLLTRAQAILLDGHFVMEHTARARSGRYFNFNGTAGVWRKKCIEDAGGWEHDTITEDLDLSYRAQMRGWKFTFLPEVVSPAELPVEMDAFRTQQHRWAKGSIETARKLLGTVCRGNSPWWVKAEAVFHLTGNVSYLLLLVLALLMPLAIYVRVKHGFYNALLADLPFFITGTVSVCGFYVCSQREIGKATLSRLAAIPAALCLGVGISINNARAVMEALVGHRSEFTRTPKYAVEERTDRWKLKKYRGKRSIQPFIELAMAAYYTAALAMVAGSGILVSLPFLLLFQLGFAYVGVVSLLQRRGKASVQVKQPAEA